MSKGLKWTLIIVAAIAIISIIVYFVNKNKSKDNSNDDLDTEDRKVPICPEGQVFDPVAGCIPIVVQNERLMITTTNPTTDNLNTDQESNNATLQTKGKLGAKIPKIK